MKKTVLYHILFVSTIFFASGQQINGIIYYQNSNGKKAAGVQVSAFGCNSVYSDSNGMFSLYCNDKKAGQKLKLEIGETDNKENPIEVVNARQLESLRVPEDSNAEPIEIIICNAGQLEQSKLKYYNILVKPTHEKYEQQLNRIEHLLHQRNLDIHTSTTLNVQIEELREERDIALEKVKEQATFIASINKDKASDLVKSAILKIEQEEDIDATLSILDNDKLEQTYQAALREKQNANAEIQQIIEAYKLKISFLTPKLKYEELIFCYQRLIKIYEDNAFDKEHLAILYTKTALAMYYSGRFLTALNYQKKSLHLIKEIKGSEYYSLGRASVYRNMATIYMAMNRFSEAIIFQEKFITILEKTYPEKHSFHQSLMQIRAGMYYKKGFLEYSNNNYFQAIESYRKAIEIDPKIIKRKQYFYNNIGLTYAKNKQFKEAKAAFEVYEALFPNDGRAYRNWGMYYALQNQKEKALAYLQKAVGFGYDDVEWFKTDNSMESLRDDRRFMEIIRKLEK